MRKAGSFDNLEAVAFGRLEAVRVAELIGLDVRVEEVFGVEEVLFDSALVSVESPPEDSHEEVLLDSVPVPVESRSEDSHEEPLRKLVPNVPPPDFPEDVPWARALRFFLILYAVIPARVASMGAAKILTTDAQNIAKKQAPRDGLHPKIR